jgi:hypothetical protein
MKIVRVKLGPDKRLGVLENHSVTLLPERKLGSGKGFLLLVRQAMKEQMSTQNTSNRLSIELRTRRF